MILLPALRWGKELRCSRRLLRKSKLQHLQVARVWAASSTSWTTWGLAGMRGGGCRFPARGSTRRPRCRFSLGRSSSGGRRRAPTASRKRALSTSFISARLSQRWRSWTTMDIAFPRDRTVTFVARRAKSVAVRSSCINPGSVLPSCTCLSALAW